MNIKNCVKKLVSRISFKSVCLKNEIGVFTQNKKELDEEKIRKEAYCLWEKNPQEGDSDYFWNKAKEKIEQEC